VRIINGGFFEWIINLFRKLIANKLRPTIEGKLCEAVRNFVMNDINRKLETFPVQINIENLVNLDYGLFSDPIVANDYMELPLKGKISHPTIPDPSPHPFTDLDQAEEWDPMLRVWLSDKILNDILFYAHRANVLKIRVTKDTDEFGKILRLRCGEEEMCIGTLIPDFVAKLPPSVEYAELMISTSSNPNVNLKGDSGSISSLGQGDLYVMIPGLDDTKKSIALASIDLAADFTAQVSNMRIVAHGNIGKLDIKITESEFNQTTIEEIEQLLQMVKPAVEFKVNEELAKGIPIPMIKEVELDSPKLRFLERTVRVQCDVKYTG